MSDSAVNQYDLFISYAHRDNQETHKGWVEALVAAIQEEHRQFSPRPLSIFLDLAEIHTMQDWEHRILRGLRHSRLMLAILSPAYFNSAYCRLEWERYREHELERALVGDGIAPIYVVAAPDFDDEARAALDEWRKDLRRRQYLDVRDLWLDGIAALRTEDVRRRIERLNQSLSMQLQRAERVLNSPTNIPLHNSHFVGRLDELRRLRESLALGKVGAVSAVHGLGGVGKSALAFEYAHAFAAEYPGGRFLLNAAGQRELRGLLASLAPQLGVALGEAERADPEAALVLVRDALLRRGTTLVVLDNVDQPALLTPERLAHCLPQREKIHLLATTRLGPDRLTGLDCLTLDVLPVSDGVRLLERYRPVATDAERVAAEQIVLRLGGHALALEVVGVYLWKMDVTFPDYLARLQQEGLQAIDDAGREDAVQLTRHPEKLLGALLESTLNSLSLGEQLAVEYAALLPPDQIALPWLRQLVGSTIPELAQPPAAGHPDPWRRLEMRLSGLRLLTPAEEPQLGRIHRLVQDVVRARLDATVKRQRMQALFTHVAARGESIRTGASSAERWEAEALRAMVLSTADRPDASWDELLQAAQAYCAAAQRTRSEGTAIEEWAARGEVQRIQTALAEERDETQRGLETLCVAIRLAQDERYAEVAESMWVDALRLLADPLDKETATLPGHWPATAILAKAALLKGSPVAPASPLPTQKAAPRLKEGEEPRLRLPWLFRCLGAILSGAGWLSAVGLSMIFVFIPLGLLTLLWDLEEPPEWFGWLAAPFALLFAVGFFGGMLILAPVEYLIHWLRRPLAQAFAELAAGIHQAKDDHERRQALREALAFRANLVSVDDRINAICQALAIDMAEIVRCGAPTIGEDRWEWIKTIERVCAMENVVIDALADALHQIPAPQVHSMLREVFARKATSLAHVRLYVGVTHHVRDAKLLVELFPRRELGADEVIAAPFLEVLQALSATELGGALRKSMQQEAEITGLNRRVPWLKRLTMHDLSMPTMPRGLIPLALRITMRVVLLAFSAIFLPVQWFFQALWNLALVAGRYHDGGDSALFSWERRRVAIHEFAARLRRGEGQPYRPGSPQRWLEQTLEQLLRRNLIAQRVRLVLFYMSDCAMLRVLARHPPDATSNGTHQSSEVTDGTEVAESAHVRPLSPVWLSAIVTLCLSLAFCSLWLGMLALWTPAAARWWWNYGWVSTLSIAAICALLQHYPRPTYRQRGLGVAVLLLAVAMHHSVLVRADAWGIGVPGLDYGWWLLYVLLPLSPVLITNLVVPETIAWWRGAAMLYPSLPQLIVGRVGAVVGAAALCAAFAGVTAYMVLDYNAKPSNYAPRAPGSDGGASHILVATITHTTAERRAILAPPGGVRGEEMALSIKFKNAIVEKGTRAPPEVHATRTLREPIDVNGKPVPTSAGQWYVPQPGTKVRFYVQDDWIASGPAWTKWNAIVPNGIDVFLDDKEYHVGEVFPVAHEPWDESKISWWDVIKGFGVLLTFLFALLLVVWLLEAVAKRWRQLRTPDK